MILGSGGRKVLSERFWVSSVAPDALPTRIVGVSSGRVLTGL